MTAEGRRVSLRAELPGRPDGVADGHSTAPGERLPGGPPTGA
jgi:hypothetical protein